MALRGIVLAAAVLEAVWMLVDGTRALVVGDFITPATGQYAGQLGPWAVLVQALGFDPRSTPIKLLFVVYGAMWLFIAAAWLRGLPWARRGMLAAAAGALWYLPVGTALSLLQIVLLVAIERRSPR